MQSTKAKETQYVHMFLINGIIHFNYKKNDLIDLDDAKIVVKDRLDFCEGHNFPYLFDITQVNKFSKEARDYFADQGNYRVLASAILINSPVTRIIANFFISVSKPKKPTKLFTSKKQALDWLSGYKDADHNSDQSNKILQAL